LEAEEEEPPPVKAERSHETKPPLPAVLPTVAVAAAPVPALGVLTLVPELTLLGDEEEDDDNGKGGMATVPEAAAGGETSLPSFPLADAAEAASL
jgi:hypothetical protein